MKSAVINVGTMGMEWDSNAPIMMLECGAHHLAPRSRRYRENAKNLIMFV
jgi:hypothetical protein